VADAFIPQTNSQTMHIKSITHHSIATFSLQNLTPWRDLNPHLQFLSRLLCQLRHAARAHFYFYFTYTNENTEKYKNPEASFLMGFERLTQDARTSSIALKGLQNEKKTVCLVCSF
jgi:hypothetical protein